MTNTSVRTYDTRQLEPRQRFKTHLAEAAADRRCIDAERKRMQELQEQHRVLQGQLQQLIDHLRKPRSR